MSACEFQRLIDTPPTHVIEMGPLLQQRLGGRSILPKTPTEPLLNVLSFLPRTDALSLERTNKKMREVCRPLRLELEGILVPLDRGGPVFNERVLFPLIEAIRQNEGLQVFCRDEQDIKQACKNVYKRMREHLVWLAGEERTSTILSDLYQLYDHTHPMYLKTLAQIIKVQPLPEPTLTMEARLKTKKYDKTCPLCPGVVAVILCFGIGVYLLNGGLNSPSVASKNNFMTYGGVLFLLLTPLVATTAVGPGVVKCLTKSEEEMREIHERLVSNHIQTGRTEIYQLPMRERRTVLEHRLGLLRRQQAVILEVD